MGMFEDVTAFETEVCNTVVPATPRDPGKWRKDLHTRLINEEVGELLTAIERGDMVGVADGVADAVWVLMGTAIVYGIDLRPVWEEVAAANMRMKDGTMRADGKLLKPEGWEGPRVVECLEEQGYVFDVPAKELKGA